MRILIRMTPDKKEEGRAVIKLFDITQLKMGSVVRAAVKHRTMLNNVLWCEQYFC